MAALSGVSGANNPFGKSDSGFISPACASSNNHSASSEDSAENHAERRGHGDEDEDGDEEAEAAQVAELLARQELNYDIQSLEA